MARRDKSGGAAWALVGNKEDGKVRCRSCSSVVFISKWWSHQCQLEDTLVDDASSQNLSTLSQSKSQEVDGDKK